MPFTAIYAGFALILLVIVFFVSFKIKGIKAALLAAGLVLVGLVLFFIGLVYVGTSTM